MAVIRFPSRAVFAKRLPADLEELLRKTDESCERAEQALGAPPFRQPTKLRLVVDNEREE
jgi:hypothetical protein